MRLTPAVWLRLFAGCLMLAATSFMLWWTFGRMQDMLGAESPFNGGAYAKLGVGALLAAALLLRWRPRGPARVLTALMPCGGLLTDGAFRDGAPYGYCSKRCVHSRADFEARRAPSS